MNTLRSFEQIIREEPGKPFYAVAPLPTWEHHSADSCPAPIVDWVAQQHPEVIIERISGFARRFPYELEMDEPEEGLETSDDLPTPIFRIDFSTEQAEHFHRAWNSPPLQPSDGVEICYFFTFYPLAQSPKAVASIEKYSSESMLPECSAEAGE